MATPRLTVFRCGGSVRPVLTFWLILLLVPWTPAGLAASPDRTELKPGWNMFNEKQDIELGQQAAKEAEKKLPILNDRRVNDYLNRLGADLARQTPGYDYPYQFTGVNDENINAFALPGGFLYMNRGTIAAAENEAQLAGVMAHEIAHVALRHGTNQLSKATLARAPLAIFGGLLGGEGGLVGQLAQLGIGVGFTAVFLKFSRSAETQADVLGAQILYDAGYDPREMAAFFETLAARNQQRSIEFFSSHPHPENRQERIMEEIRKMGGRRANARKDSEEFHLIQNYVNGLPAPSKSREGRGESSGEESARRPEAPSSRLVSYSSRDFSIRYPANWRAREESNQVTFLPDGAEVGDGLAYGVIVSALNVPDRDISLEEATERLAQQIQQSNPSMRQLSRQRTRVDGRRALVTSFEGRSPLGEKELDWLFTVFRGDDLFYLIFVVPESDENAYRGTFRGIVDSFRLR